MQQNYLSMKNQKKKNNFFFLQLHNVETASLSSTRKTLSEINDLWEQLDGTAKAVRYFEWNEAN